MAQAMTPLNVGLVALTSVFDIRNGPANTARNVYTRPTIGGAFHWIGVGALPMNQAVHHIGAYIRSAYGLASVMAVPGRSAAQIRKIAICLGVSRAVMTQYYSVHANEIVVGEKTPYGVYTWHAAVAAGGNVNAAPARCVVIAQPAQYAAVANPIAAAAQAMPDLSALERDVCTVLLVSALGTLPIQGYSLINSNHHYLSEAGSLSKKAFEAVEKQHWKAQDVAQWFADDLEIVRDAMWHKAGHPVIIDLKIRLAKDTQIPRMLTDAGAGSACPRLPAVEVDMRVASSYVALFSTCSALFLQNGGAMDYTVLSEAMAAVTAYEVAAGLRVPAPVAAHGNTVDLSVVSRETAITWLRTIMERNQASAAYAYGFYVKMQDSTTDAVAGAGKDTLRAAYSLRKLEDLSRASFMGGQEAFKDFEAASKARRAAGRFAPPMVVLQ